MRFFDSITSAMQSLRANLLRSILTTLGIIIGVAAVIVMVAVGAGAEARMESIIKSLGTNLIYLVPGSGRSGGARLGGGSLPTLTSDDAAAIQREIDSVQVTSPLVRGTRQVVYGNANWGTSIYGATPDEIETRDWTILEGRNFTDREMRSAAKVAILGTTVAEKLFGEADPIGETIRVHRVPHKIIGLLAEKGETPLGRDQDDAVFIPLTTAKKRVLGGRRISGNLVTFIAIKIRDARRIKEAEGQIRDLLRQRHRIGAQDQEDFSVRNMAEMLQKRQQSSRVMSMLLGAVASISMIVGGIGIMNIMLVSVTERTREIGLRMAVGASRGAILAQFLIESVLLSLFGGILGIGFGILATMLTADIVSLPMQMRPEAGLIAFVFAGLVGVFFGYYPARRASRLDPIEALRYE